MNITNENVTCWKHFNCPKKYRDNCPVYLNNSKSQYICEGWLIFNNGEGGPAKKGPCFTCDMFRKKYPNISKLFD